MQRVTSFRTISNWTWISDGFWHNRPPHRRKSSSAPIPIGSTAIPRHPCQPVHRLR